MDISVLRLGPIGTNCYIFREMGNARCGVVDPGGQGKQLAEWLAERGLRPDAVLLTHGHFDHIMAIPALREAWPALPVYCHPADFGQGDSVEMLGRLYPTVQSFQNILPYREGDVVEVAGFSVEVLETPGHTPGSVTLRLEDALFTGDTLFAGSMGRTDFEGGDEGQMMQSLKRLYNLEGDYRVLPGHEGQSTLDRERRTNPFMRDAVNRF